MSSDRVGCIWICVTVVAACLFGIALRDSAGLREMRADYAARLDVKRRDWLALNSCIRVEYTRYGDSIYKCPSGEVFKLEDVPTK